MRTVLNGNDAVALAVRMARTHFISAYPITPQTSIVEHLAEMVAGGELQARFLRVESEHSAMAACIAASSAGARAFTATSSHGLLLMHELLHWAAGARLPILMAEVNRAIGPGWNIWVDQTDTLSQRDTGWMQVYCASVQEVLDSVLQGFEVARRVLLPCMIILDAFFLSHTCEDVEVPSQSDADRLIRSLDIPQKLDVEKPASLGNLVGPDRYMEFRRRIDCAHSDALEAWQDVGQEWWHIAGRRYGLVEEYKTDDAEIVLVASSTPASTAMQAVTSLREQGIPAGLLRLRVYRPFPAQALRRVLAKKRIVVVLDRSVSFGSKGIFHQEVESALYSLPPWEQPVMRSVIAGLGGRDITPEDIQEILSMIWTERLREPVTWWKTLPTRETGVPGPMAEAGI